MLFSAFLGKNVLFSVECPIFPENATILKVLGTKNDISFKVCYSVLISWEKNFCLASLGIKFTPICTTVHMYL